MRQDIFAIRIKEQVRKGWIKSGYNRLLNPSIKPYRPIEVHSGARPMTEDPSWPQKQKRNGE
jgi:hypothetical protein